jgi:hypothetical protein
MVLLCSYSHRGALHTYHSMPLKILLGSLLTGGRETGSEPAGGGGRDIEKEKKVLLMLFDLQQHFTQDCCDPRAKSNGLASATALHPRYVAQNGRRIPCDAAQS